MTDQELYERRKLVKQIAEEIFGNSGVESMLHVCYMLNSDKPNTIKDRYETLKNEGIEQ